MTADSTPNPKEFFVNTPNAKRTVLALKWALLALLVLGLSPAGALAERADPKPRVFSPNAQPYGQSYGEWAADWWQWVLTQPAATNPLTDPTGAQCANNQQGPVWFLVGTTGGSANRTCTVPTGKALLFPVVNNVYAAFAFDPSGAVPPDPREQRTEAFVRNAAHFTASGLTATIDGASVPNIEERYFEQSALFSVTLPAGNLFGLSEGFVLDPCADEGYYLMVKPLSPGRHTISLAGTLQLPGQPAFEVAASYEIIVSSSHDSDDD
jgi:hypothetical protein